MRRGALRTYHLLVIALGWGCGAPYDVSGTFDKVVGEEVVVDLIKGERGFSAAVLLRDSERREFDGEALSPQLEPGLADTQIRFFVPPGVAPGAATARIAQNGSSETYPIPLDISRLAILLDDQGRVFSRALPGSTAGGAEITSDQGGFAALISLSPNARQLFVLFDGGLQAFWLGENPREIAGISTEFQGAVALAAFDGGAVVGRDSQLQIVEAVKGRGVGPVGGGFTVTSLRSISVSGDSKRALALTGCSASVAEESCLTVLTLAGRESALVGEIPISGRLDELRVLMSSDGRHALAVDRTQLQWVRLDPNQPDVLRSPWPTGVTPRPVAMSRALTTFAKSEGTACQPQAADLFAIADAESTAPAVRTWGFDACRGVLSPVQARVLEGVPVDVSFGRGTELFVAAENKISKVVFAAGGPSVEETPLVGQQRLVALAVQR